MSNQYQPPPNWSPPGAQFRTSGGFGRTLGGIVIGLAVTPIGIGLAAYGAATTSRWVILGDTADRLSSTLQVVLGALLLLLVAALAAYSPAGTVMAGLVWGVFPGVVYFLFPDDTFRLIQDLPLLSQETRLAVHAWVINGSVFLVGVLLVGAGLAATLRRR
ncbi:hypothetical protein [Nocardia sp. NPDC005366]|uniref:hypothetical protein n=1 Tax=Nocardia sp. NPDC005366 TaxID=3156878 RepID=UPI0033B093F8